MLFDIGRRRSRLGPRPLLGTLLVVAVALALLTTGLPGRRADAAATAAVAVAAVPGGSGTWIVFDDGSIEPHGGAPNFGSLEGTPLARPIVGMAPTPAGDGYWLVASDGGVFAFGAARFHGSTGALRLNAPIVGMAPTPTGGGYWLVARDGGVFTFGDAPFRGSLGSLRLNGPIVGLAATPSGQGYWLVGADGGVFAHGDAAFHGSTGAMALNAPVRGIATPADGRGYWLVAADGGVFTFGSAPFLGTRARAGVTAITRLGEGYAVVDATGGLTGSSPAGVVDITTGTLVVVPPAPVADGAAREGRDPFLWPFSVDSPWNQPIGSGARYASATDQRTLDLRQGSAGINAGTWSHPIYLATPTDPVRTARVRSTGTTSSYRIPDAAVPAAYTGSGSGDSHLHVVSPDHRWVDEAWSVTRRADRNLDVGHAARVDLRGTGVGGGGVRAYGGSAIGGLIRTWELAEGEIHHALALAIPRSELRVGPVWPATTQDGGASGYAGSVPMGSLVAIPPTVDLTRLGLTPAGLVLARALQDHGAYVVDSSGRFVFYAEPAAERMPELAQMRTDVERLQDLLLPVTNNTPATPGGGGTPRVPLAPALAP